MQSKIAGLLGLALRARKATCGVNSIGFLKGRVYLLLACGSASENTLKDVVSLSKRFNCKTLITKTLKLEDLVGKENCKVVAITDEHFADGMLKANDDNFTIMEA